jgi:integrase
MKRGGTYYAVWYVGHKKFVKTTGEQDRKKAQVELNRIMRPFVIGDEATTLENIATTIAGRRAELVKLDDENNPPLTVDAAFGAYLASAGQADVSDGAARNYKSYWKHFTGWLKSAHPEAERVRDVTLGIAQEYADHLAASNLTPRTYNAYRAFLRAFWNATATKSKLVTEYTTPKGYVTRNPWAMLKKRPEASQGRRRLSLTELQNVCSLAQGELRTLLCLGLYLGARLGDCATLKWGAVDFQKRMVTYTPHKTAKKVPKPLNTHMHPELFAILSETPQAARTGYILPTTAHAYIEQGAAAVTKGIQAHFEACGIATTEERTGAGVRRVTVAGFHSLRHSSVSLIRDAGAAQSVSQAIAGHSGDEIHRLYTHADPEAIRRAVESLPPVLTRTPALPPADPLTALKAAVRAAADRLGADTWGHVKTELEQLTGNERTTTK